jgi:4-hydroxybenzoyl-CoA reductase subunit beta
LHGWRSTYWKLRRRGSFDFPVLSVAAAVRINTATGTGAACCATTNGSGVIQEGRIVIGSGASRPLVAEEAAKFLVGRSLTTETIAEAAALAARIAKPLDNTDFDMSWRKKVTGEFVTYALRELRGDDVSTERVAITRMASI